MTVIEIFDSLLTVRQVTLLVTRQQAETLRTSLTRKLKVYKYTMGRLGFLDSSLETLVISLEYEEENQIGKLFLRERKNSAIQYTVLVEPTDSGDTVNAP